MSKIFLASLIAMVLFTNNLIAKDNKPIEKEWTFLLFLNGHNNLDEFGGFNINQMEEIGSSSELNMVVQWASLENVQTKRIYVEKDNDIEKVTSPAIETLDPVDMGDYKKLIEFVDWGVKKYPAKHYMIAVWNHGSGWHKLKREKITRDISNDDLTGNKITTEELAIAMEESAKLIGHKVDIYGSDACLMAMVEVGSQMQKSVDYMVGSTDLEPGTGWPYNTWMNRWTQKPDSTPEDVSKFLVQEYAKSYDGGIYGSGNVTLSAMNLNNLPKLEEAIKNLRISLTALSTEEIQATKNAAEDTSHFYYFDYKDLGEFTDKLATSKANIKLSVLTDVKDSMKSVLIENGATGSKKDSQGISIWLPLYKYDLIDYRDRYSKLQFSQNTDWLKYLSLITK